MLSTWYVNRWNSSVCYFGDHGYGDAIKAIVFIKTIIAIFENTSTRAFHIYLFISLLLNLASRSIYR